MDLSEDEVRKSIGGVGDFLRMEEKDESPAARDTVGSYLVTLATARATENARQPVLGGYIGYNNFFWPFSLSLQLLAKIPRLQARITLVVFNYVRRGLVEKDKLIVASLIALRIMRHGDSGVRIATEAFVSPQPGGDSVMYPEEARR